MIREVPAVVPIGGEGVTFDETFHTQRVAPEDGDRIAALDDAYGHWASLPTGASGRRPALANSPRMTDRSIGFTR